VSSYDTEQDLQDSPTTNLLPAKPRPTHYAPLHVPAIPSGTEFNFDPFIRTLLTDGASLPPPTTAPRAFQAAPPLPLMDQAVQDLLHTGILQHDNKIVNAFRMFLVSKPDGAARAILDLSPWTPFYKTPPMQLYSAAEVLTSLQPHDQIIKVDLKSGFYHFQIQAQQQRFYGTYYRGVKYKWTRLPMGHSLAPSIMQRFSTDNCTPVSESAW
jgi:hypothetical protein